MNTHEHPSNRDQSPPRGAPEPLSRRRFIVMSAALLGALGRPCEPLAAGPAGASPPQAGGPRERALRAADLYRPHTLAG